MSDPVPRLRYGLVFVIGYVAWAALYYAINDVTAGRSAAVPLLPGEEDLPLVTALYPVYALVYVQVFVPLFLARSKREFWTVQAAFVTASLVGFAVFLAAPMPYPKPPIAVDNVFDQLLAWEYASDGARNTFPSLHVSFAWTLWLAHRGFSRAWGGLLLASAVGVSVACVLVKQHFVVDVPAGMLLAWASWKVAPRLFAQLERRFDHQAGKD